MGATISYSNTLCLYGVTFGMNNKFITIYISEFDIFSLKFMLSRLGIKQVSFSDIDNNHKAKFKAAFAG